jgi:hypothetical protein
MVTRQLQRAGDPSVHAVVGGLKAQHERRAAAVTDTRERDLVCVEQSAVGRLKARLGQGPYAEHSLLH